PRRIRRRRRKESACPPSVATSSAPKPRSSTARPAWSSPPASSASSGPRHAPLITLLKPGAVEVIDAQGERHPYYVSGGILEVQPTVVTVLADTALRARDIDEASARRAKEEAERMLGNRGDAKTVAEA